MAIETELKLSISPGHLKRLKRHPLLKTLAISAAATEKLHSIYYDTPALDLRRDEKALRLRRVGRRWLQTLKGGGSVQAGLHLRDEWETPAAGGALDFDALHAAGGKVPKRVRNKLQPIFVTDFSRYRRLLAFGGAEIELSLDSGEIRAGKNIRPISELELELKSGSPQQLFRLAQMLLDIVPLQVEHASKAEYGYNLFSGDKSAVLKVDFPSLAAAQSIASALHSMIVSCLQHVQTNVPGAILNLDEEYLHQVRVGLRRLRVVLAMAEGCCRADDELESLHRQVAKMCIDFGRLREWDVFVTQTLAQVSARLPEHAGLRMLIGAGKRQRARHHADVVSTLRSPDYQRFLLRFGAWLNGGYWGEQPAAAEASRTGFAARILEHRNRQVHKRWERLDIQTMKQQDRESMLARASRLHALRIACKKLRYSTEMFASLFALGNTGRYLALLSRLQDILGVLNDIAVARRLLDSLENEERHLAVELVRGWIEHDHAEKMGELGRAWKRFSRQKKFWG